MKTIWAEQALLADDWANDVVVEIDHGRIISIHKGQPPRGIQVGVLLPSPVNVHSHAFQRAMAGLTECRSIVAHDNFWTWRELMYRFLDRLTPEHVQSIAAMAQMEMLEAGFSTCVEFHYLHHQPDGQTYENLAETAERIAAAASQTGIGLTLLPVHYQYGGCDQRPLTGGQLRFGNDLERYLRLHEESMAAINHLPQDCRTGYSAHSLRAVSRDDLLQLRSLTGDVPFHLHAAEQSGEVDEVLAAYGRRPVEWILEYLSPDRHMCLIHCTQMLAYESQGLAKSGAIVGLCPITESSLGDGIFNGVAWMNAGGQFSIGTDSNTRISMPEELRTLEYSQRLQRRSRAVLSTAEKSTGRYLYETIAKAGGHAAGRQSGCIASGNWADLIALDQRQANLVDLNGDQLLDTLLFTGENSWITDVWSAGRHVVREGHHRERDVITSEYIKVIKTLREEL